MMKALCVIMLAAVFSCSVFAGDAPRMKDGKLTIEAESGKANEKMKIVKDEIASGGGAIVSAKGGVVVYEFMVDEAGEYVIWGKVLGPDGNKDSFFVIINGEEQIIWDMGCKSYTWKAIKGRKNKDIKHKLKKGKNRITLKCREPEARIDQIHITKPGNKPPAK
ncbi:MAG: hypothetical protein L3J71_18305 [Victivallaceae bacterium]|nr:hypothetical protein [Victivallaceae bacterium]